MSNITVQLIDDYFKTGIVANRSKWSLLEGKTPTYDVINHVLRVILQLGHLGEYISEFEALSHHQHSDGGWGNHPNELGSGIRNTCFATRNLIRANRVLNKKDFAIRIERAVRYVISKQDPEGFWPDRTWGPLDATSSAIGLLVYTRKEYFGTATKEIHAAANDCLNRAKLYLEHTQASNGSWIDDKRKEEAVGSTAHLLPKLVLVESKNTSTIGNAIDFLINSQDEDGFWDDKHIDHTCDSIRALLLTYSVIADLRILQVIERGIVCLQSTVNPDGGWGIFPGRRSSLLMTCDVLDAFSKYEAHCNKISMRTFWE
ncbi:hypothetical protein CN894_11735 [Bacillus thuringiensis]|uniref:prenyltransferase/squalene oxidase repeat-containing protein n=1 Tax=Bacillus thuringiensis TaxID=1428 RepID=UPI000BFC7ECF|nr:prenyltransferase/squalene oxidase repeat-containing protein [Bacillus thuringiensis]PGH72150.1 hypothetical protein CN894_11735 [Bacillus thuringiensis]